MGAGSVFLDTRAEQEVQPKKGFTRCEVHTGTGIGLRGGMRVLLCNSSWEVHGQLISLKHPTLFSALYFQQPKWCCQFPPCSCCNGTLLLSACGASRERQGPKRNKPFPFLPCSRQELCPYPTNCPGAVQQTQSSTVQRKQIFKSLKILSQNVTSSCL